MVVISCSCGSSHAYNRIFGSPMKSYLTILIMSPKKLPNIIPQNIVEIPQYIYIITVFRFCPSGLHLSKINSVAKNIMRP